MSTFRWFTRRPVPSKVLVNTDLVLYAERQTLHLVGDGDGKSVIEVAESMGEIAQILWERDDR